MTLRFISILILFFRFYDKRDAEDALEAMDGRILDGRELRVQMARYGRPTSPQRSRNNGRHDRRRRSRSRDRSRDRRRSRSWSRNGGGGGGGGGGRG